MRATRLVGVRILVLLFVFVLLALGFGLPYSVVDFPTPVPLHAEENQPDAPGRISGVVRDPSGVALQGIPVNLYFPSAYNQTWSAFAQTVTDEFGRYRFGLLGAGLYRVGLSDPEQRFGQRFYPDASDIYSANSIAINGQNRDDIDFQLAIGGEITGTIRLVDESGQSSRSITLYQKIDGYYSQYGGLVEWLMVAPQTLALGQKDFHFRGLAADEYRICAYAYLDGQESNECYDNVSDLHDATSISVTAGTVISNITMLLMDGADWAMITGTVKSASGEPLAGIDLYVAGTGAPPIDQSMSPSSKQPEQAWRIAAASSPWGALPHATAANAIPNSIPAFPLSYRTSTDENGNYAIKFLTAGPYQVLFYDSIGRYRYEFYDDVTFSANSTMIAVRKTEIISNVNVSLDIGGQITGRVSVWGQPAPNAQLYLHKAENGGWFPVSYTSVDPFTGSYAFRGLPAGRYRVQASAFILYPPISTYYLYGMYGGDNWGTATDIKLAAAETRSDIDIAMSQGPHFDGAISGKVTANGKPLANVQVGLYNPYGCCYPFVIGPPQTYAVTDADGRYRIEGLTLSGFLVRFRDLSGIHASLYYPNQPTVDYGQTVIISDTATTTDIDIDLPIGGSIQGQLYQADGKALKGIPIIAALETSSYPNVIYDETVTGDDGSYQLTGLYPGTYYICAGAYEVFIYGNGQRECYGERDVPWYNDWGQAITVQASSAIENIDILWGPDHYIRLPIIAR